MRLRRLAEHTEAFRNDVRDSVVGLGQGDTEVRDAQVALVEDVTGTAAWRVTLVLPRPRHATWNVDETLDLQEQVRRKTDELADVRDLDVDGLTVVVLTTDQAPPEDVALDDELEPGEGLDAADDEPST